MRRSEVRWGGMGGWVGGGGHGQRGPGRPGSEAGRRRQAGSTHAAHRDEQAVPGGAEALDLAQQADAQEDEHQELEPAGPAGQVRWRPPSARAWAQGAAHGYGRVLREGTHHQIRDVRAVQPAAGGAREFDVSGAQVAGFKSW